MLSSNQIDKMIKTMEEGKKVGTIGSVFRADFQKAHREALNEASMVSKRINDLGLDAPAEDIPWVTSNEIIGGLFDRLLKTVGFTEEEDPKMGDFKSTLSIPWEVETYSYIGLQHTALVYVDVITFYYPTLRIQPNMRVH